MTPKGVALTVTPGAVGDGGRGRGDIVGTGEPSLVGKGDGACVTVSIVGSSVAVVGRLVVGSELGALVGTIESSVGSELGALVGTIESIVGSALGALVGSVLGALVGVAVCVGTRIGGATGTGAAGTPLPFPFGIPRLLFDPFPFPPFDIPPLPLPLPL
jgi:hypothetical protein